MAKGVIWDGFKEYQEELRRLPTDCVAEAERVTRAAANSAFVVIAAVYVAHEVTGTLRRLLTIKPITARGVLTTGVVLRSGSRIAWLFDNGSKARHWLSGKSTGKMWGRSSPTHIFAGTVGRMRRQMAQEFREMLFRHGASKVTGE